MRRALLVLLVMGILLAGALAVAVREAPRLAEHAIRFGGRTLGYQGLDATVSHVGLHGMTIETLSAGPPPGFSLEGIELGYAPRTLRAGRVASVKVASAVLYGLWSEEEGIVFPSLPVSEGGPWLSPPAFDHLELAHARVELGGARGPVVAKLSRVELGAPPGERLRAKLALDVERAAGSVTGDLDVVLDGDTVNGHARLRNADKTLDLALDLGAPGPAPGRFPDVAGPEDLKLSGRLTIRAEEADLSPLTPSLDAAGTVDFRAEGGRLRVRSDGVDLAAFGLDVAGLELAVDLDRLAPPAAPGGQRVSVRSLQVGMDLGGGELRFGLREDGVLEIQSLDWRFHGGRLTSVARLDPRAERNELLVGVGQVDLASLVQALGRDDLQATGRVSGELPLRLEGDRIFADGGRLTSSEEGGVIRYQSGRAPGSEGQGLGIVLDALENFHYRRLEVGMEGELTGELKLTVRLEGSNPDVYEGHPFQVNLNLEGPLADVVKGSTAGFRVQDAVEKRVEQQRKRKEKR